MTDLERIAKEATNHGMTYGEYTEKEREEEMKFKVSTTVATYDEVMAIVQALVGIVNNINVTDCEGEDNNGDNN